MNDQENLSRALQIKLSLGVIALSLPHLGYLPISLAVGMVLLWIWRMGVSLERLPAPGRWLLLLVTLGSCIYVVGHYGGVLGRDAGVALLTLMLALKLLEMRTIRDGYLTILLSFFLSISHFLFSQEIPVVLYVFAVTAYLLILLKALEFPDPESGTAGGLGLIVKIVLQGLPLVAVLFILFPRLSGPLWNLDLDGSSAVSGLDDEMSPGRISRLSQSDEVAFRVEFRSEVPATEELYWRGPVLWHTDGRTWRAEPPGARPSNGGETGKVIAEGEPVIYNLTLEPHRRTWIFALDMPIQWDDRYQATAEGNLVARSKLRDRQRYTATSVLRYRTAGLSGRDWEWGTQLPDGLSPRVKDLAQRWRSEAVSDIAVAEQALAYFRQQPFVYTLQPPPLGADPVDEFLFDTRQGFCEHYSSAFTTLMRAAGIPARVVTGYQGGERNPLARYFIVRQAQAHAWAEVWLEDRGWVRFDPTAAVAPERVRLSVDSAAVGERGEVRFRVKGDWLRQAMDQLGYGWDAVSASWNEWVLAYGPDSQRALLRRLGLDRLDWAGLGILLLVGLGVALGLAWLLSGRRATKEAYPENRIFQRFREKLAKVGVRSKPHEGPNAFQRRIAVARPDLSKSVEPIVCLYVQLHYGRPINDEETRRHLRALRVLVNRFKPKTSL